jgi:cytochrome P450
MEKFDPDRFDSTDMTGRWLPFSGGARNCLGQVRAGWG